jgi:translocation and assembly module TamB
MRRALLAAALVIVLVAALVAAAGAWLLYTEAGLVWSLARARGAVDGLTVEQPSGTWARGVAVKRLGFDSADLRVSAAEVRLVLSPWSVLLAHPRVSELSSTRVHIATAAGEERGAPPASLALPVNVDIAAARVDELVVERDAERNVLTDVFLSYAGGVRRHDVRQLRAGHALGRLEASGRIGTASPFPLSADVNAALENPALAVDAQLAGTLFDLEVRSVVRHAAAQAAIEALLTPFADTPLARLEASSTEIDLRRFDPELPRTLIAAHVALEARDAGWSGPLRLTNAASGPWDEELVPLASLRAELALGMEHAELRNLQAIVGAQGRVGGNAMLERDRAVLRLDVRGLDLRDVHSALRETALRGRIDATLAGERQTASATLVEDGMELAFDAARSGDDIRVRRFTARARATEARGEGRLSLAGERAYAVTAALTRFDPSDWGDFPAGSINGRFDAEGALAREEIRLRYTLRPSTLFGEKLDGSGRLTYTPRRISSARFELALGGNRVQAAGAFGAPGDNLALRLDGRNLTVLDARASGAVSGSAQLSGTWDAPAVSADLTGRGLAFEGQFRAGSAMLRGEYRTSPTPALRAALDAREVQAAGWSGERVRVTAEGTHEAHRLTLRARGGQLDLALQARGGWDGESWSGVLEQARNAGPVPFDIATPVTVEIARERVLVGPFTARLMDGGLDVARFSYRSGIVESEGRFARLPVRPVAALAGLALRPQDTLTLSGNWSVTRRDRLAIAFAVQRDSGDLTLGESKALAMGLETLAAEGRLVDGRLRVEAIVQSRLLAGSAEGTVATTQDGALERIDGDSPVRFAAKLELARLAVFSDLMGTAAHVDGRVRATLTGTGTVGKPALSGDVHADSLALALPPEGIDLRDGTLRARLTANRIEVREFTIHGGDGTLTAQGTLALLEDGRSTLDWRAERLRLLARPDRRLIVTGSGNASLDNGKLALGGALRANEGYFRFGETALPKLGPDVIVSGREPQPVEQPAGLTRASLNLALDLGSDLHIVGHGLDAWIEGRVVLTTDAQGRLLANGTVRTQRGTYTALGQRLQIDRGQVAFGGPVENPGLDIVAMRKNQAVEAGVAVTGTVRAPLVRVVSDPPVPEGEALSWLVLGRGPADASRADLAMLPLAAAALFGRGKTDEETFAKRLGVDTIALRGAGGGGGGGGGGLGEQVLAIGKRVSSRLYVVYEQGLGAATNVLKIEYNLTRRFLLRAEAGEVSAAGLFFRYAFD